MKSLKSGGASGRGPSTEAEVGNESSVEVPIRYVRRVRGVWAAAQAAGPRWGRSSPDVP